MKNKLNPKISNKQDFKHIEKTCKICKTDIYDVLDIHRIKEGKNKGEYTVLNGITLCSNCHRLCHSGKIKIDKKYFSSNGWVLHYWDEKGIEHFD